MFKYNEQTGRTVLDKLELEGEPTELQTVAKANDGTIFTSGYLTGGNARFDPFTGKLEAYTTETLGYEQKLAATQTDRIFSYKHFVYFSVYPNMMVYEFDTRRPWNVQDQKSPNPRLLFSGFDVNKQDRGLAGTLVQELGKLIIGTVPKYGMLGGALLIYDLIKDEREAYYAPVEQQSVCAIAYMDGLVYGGTSVWGGLGVEPIAKEAKLFIWDIETKQKVFELTPVPGARAITELLAGPDGFIWGSAEGFLFVLDPASRQIVHLEQLFPRTYTSTVWRDTQLQIGTDGNVYGVQYGKFFMIDARTKQMTMIRDGKRNWLTQDDFGHFYLTEGDQLIKLIIPNLIVKLIGIELTVSDSKLACGQTADIELKALLEKNRVISCFNKQNAVFFSSNSSVICVADGKLKAKQAGKAEIWVQVEHEGILVESNRVIVTSQ